MLPIVPGAGGAPRARTHMERVIYTKTRLSDHWDSDARRARQYHLVIAQRAAGLEMGRRTLGQADRGGKVICALSRACQLGSLSP